MEFKKVSALALAGMMTLSLAACGGSSDSASSTDASAKTEDSASSESKGSGDVTLTVGLWDSNQQPGLEEIMADFTAQTGIKTEVQLVTWSEYWTMLSAAAQGGSLPDVFWMHANESVRYMSNDILLDLTDQIVASEKIQTENYPADIWDLYTWEDKNYAVPKDVDTIALLYDKTLFDAAGVDYPTNEWTWEDLSDAAIKIHKATGAYGYAMSCTDFQSGYANWIYSYDGYMLDQDTMESGFDTDETIEAMELLDSLVKSGAMPTQEVMSENEASVLIENGQLAMTSQGSWMLAEFKANEYTAANCDFVELPMSSKTGKRASIYNGLGWAASAATEYPEEAWQLIEYLGSEEAQIKQAELGVTMSAFIGTSDAWVNAAPDFNLQAYLNMWDNMYIYPHSKNTTTWTDAINATFKQVWMGEKTMKEGCLQAAEDMNEVLAEE